jgi:hypothetical protein
MMTPAMLNEIAQKANGNKAIKFWEEFKPSLFGRMANHAESGDFSCTINASDKDLNPYGWMSCTWLYKKVIKELEQAGFDVTHNDDRDGTYIIIKW